MGRERIDLKESLLDTEIDRIYTCWTSFFRHLELLVRQASRRQHRTNIGVDIALIGQTGLGDFDVTGEKFLYVNERSKLEYRPLPRYV